MYVGRIQFNLNDGKKEDTYFQADYELNIKLEELENDRTHQNAGVSLIEMLIGIVISAIIIGAMYTTYSVINQTYSRVSDVAGISKWERYSFHDNERRKDGRFKYYYGYNAENEARPEAERIPRIDYLQLYQVLLMKE